MISIDEIKKEFENITGINEAKKIYKQLAKKLHPDVGGSNEEFKILNNVYNDLIEHKIFFSSENKFDIELEKIISQILHYENITIEVIGSWIWLSGDTRAIKDKLKGLTFKWAICNKQQAKKTNVVYRSNFEDIKKAQVEHNKKRNDKTNKKSQGLSL
jgi:hypothetical protein